MANYFDKYDDKPSANYFDKYDEPAKPAVETLGQTLKTNIQAVPRQLGLTARHAIEGLGETADFLVSPVRALQNAIAPAKYQAQTGMGKQIADYLGLPTPENSTERVVGEAAKLIAGGGGMVGAAGKVANLAKAGSKLQGAAQLLAANPTQQLASAAGSGIAGGSVKEAGGDDITQLAASVLGGLAAPAALAGGQGVVNKAKQLAKAITKQPQVDLPSIDIKINNALQGSGIDFKAIPDAVKQSIRADVSKALQTGGNITPDAVQRLAEYRMVGATPTAATISLHPVAITQQKNLAKIGANSKDQAAQILANVENQNNARLIGGLNELGANTTKDPLAGGTALADALSNYDSAWGQVRNQYYQKARDASGRSALLDPHAFTNQANDMLEENLLQSKLPTDVRNLMNKAATGEMPLTVDVAEQLKTRIGDLQRASNDRAERMALGQVRNALENTPLLPGQEIGEDAMKAFKSARRINRAYMGIVDKTPALQAIRDGVEPDKFVQQFIVGQGANAATSKVQNLANILKKDPETMQVAKDQITAYLKSKALNQAADEVGNFSSSNYNKALQSIGDEKLKAFFSPEEIAQMKSIGKVASYEQFQPRGSAVGNSNTAAVGLGALGNLVDMIGKNSLISKIPFGESILSAPAQNISIGLKANRALDLANALKTPQAPLTLDQKLQKASPMLLPSLLMYGQQQQ